jgi:hypothetical protein
MRPIETSWDAFVDQAVQPTMDRDNVAALRLAFLHGYTAGLSDLSHASQSSRECMECAWAKLIDDAAKAWAIQADAVNKLREQYDARAKLN